MKRIVLLIIVVISVCAQLNAELRYRYSFDNNVTDSIGNANGQLINNGADAYYVDSTLEMANSELPNSNSSDLNYIDLPNGIISSLSPGATFEAWVTWHGPSGNSWQRIFDFGTSDNGEDFATSGSNSTYFFLSPCSGNGTYRFGHRRGAELGSVVENVIDSAQLPVEQEVHVAVVWDDINSIVKMYQNGQLVASGDLLYSLSNVPDVNNWLGRSQWADTAFNGVYNEFRIYNEALSDQMIAASYQAGPDTPISTYDMPKNPAPAANSNIADDTPLLNWESDPSSDITLHRIYFGDDYTSVLTGNPSNQDVYMGAVAPGVSSFQISEKLQINKTYFWRIEEVTTNYVFSSPIWSFSVVSNKANNPLPSDTDTGIAIESTLLSWASGTDAIAHRVLFGQSKDSVQLLADNISESSYSLPTLEYNTDYYWRVDEIYQDSSIITGDIWSFTTRPESLSCFQGDLNGDCNITIDDLVLFSQQWLFEAGCVGYDGICADFIGNDGVKIDDFAFLAEQWASKQKPAIVINEIHYHSDSNIEQLEFVELYNNGEQAVDLNGWSFDDAIEYTFQGIPLLYPGEYIVICKNRAHLFARYGINAYGPFEGKLSNEGEKIVLRNQLGDKIDQVEYDSQFPWPVAANGEGPSMELINPSLDNDLSGSWRSSGYHLDSRPELSYGLPTPGYSNSVLAVEIPPQIRQVRHSPNQPLSSEPIIISAKVTDLESVSSVTLFYQAVTPGNYIPAYLPVEHNSLLTDPHQSKALNPDFEDSNNWIEIPMLDDGNGMDQSAGDNVYTVQLQPQINRTLLRYRIQASDSTGNSVRVPYADDDSLNFACFVYDGVPDYTTTDSTVQPDGVGYSYSSDKLTTIPVYTLITRPEDLYECNGYNTADQIDQGSTSSLMQDAGRAYNWEGAFVYDGQVYDHIGYRLRGGNGRYNNGGAGKRSMKFKFNRGNYFQARDIYGKKFPSKWQHLNTGKMFGNKIVWEYYRNYPYGVNEVTNMMLFDIVNVPSPHTYWMHFRVIDGQDEAPTYSGGQYNGDFWGLYVAFENYDGAFLDRLGLPKGNLYKLSDKVYEGERQLRYQGPESVSDASDYENIRWNLNHEASADFIRNYLDCDEWYRYHTVAESIRHYDIFSGASCVHCLKNSAWFFYPEYNADNDYLGKLQFLPFDVDDTWGPFFNQGCDHAKAAIFDQRYVDYLETFTPDPKKSPLKQEYRNYIREFRDLVWQPDVIDPLILELASIIADIVPADRDRWRNDPTPGGAIDNGPLEDGIALMQQFAWTPGDFDGRYYWEGTSNHLENLASEDDDGSNIPDTPIVNYIGSQGYPENDLWFQVSTFSDPQGNNTFAAMKWRIAEFEPTGDYSGPYIESLIESQAIDWRYFRAINGAPSNGIEWASPDFNDNSWQVGQTSIGYGDSDDNTDLNSQSPAMQGNYTTIYLRKDFEMFNLNNITSISLNLYVDDGCIVYINGTEILRHHCNAAVKDWNSNSGEVVNDAAWESVSLPVPYDYFVEGDNTIAIHVLNQGQSSSDLSIDVELSATYDSGEDNTVYAISPKKYEIDPIWESDDITTYESDILMPANGIKPGRTYRVRCKMKDNTGRWSHWSAPVEFIAGDAIPSPLREHLRITELMYNNGDSEFIELYNTGTESLDLSDLSFTSGITFSFADSAVTTLDASQYVLVIKDQFDFNQQFGTSLDAIIAGEYKGSLSNGGEVIKLEDTWDGTIAEFEYNDARGWPLAADGAGHSIIPQDWAIEDQPLGTLNFGGNWRASTFIGGSPGAPDPVVSVNVVINEFMAHTDFIDPVNYPDYDSNDWIELYNSGIDDVYLDSNWYLSDDSDQLNKWPLPSIQLPANNFVSFDEISGFHSPISSGFGLDKAGEEIFLSYLPGNGQDRVIDCIEFEGQANSVSLGRFPDGMSDWLAFAPSTRDTANANPIEHLVISEFMYHPDESQIEYIEIFNPTDSTVNLSSTLPVAGETGWNLDGAVEYAFPVNASIPAQSRVLVLGFNPTDTQLLNEFIHTYNLDTLSPGVNVFGPWEGSLSNDGERITLERPQDSDDPMAPLEVSWIIVDECIYNDYWPWPAGADGTGLSLQRVSSSPDKSGNNPDNWQATIPTPIN